MNDEIAYSMTHEVFYATDFGRSKCMLPGEVCRYLELWVPAWTQSYLESGNWDLTAELIMVAECLGGSDRENDALSKLVLQQRPDGTLPGPIGAGGLLRNGAESPVDEAFFESYHTTLVAAMATWLRLRNRNEFRCLDRPAAACTDPSLERT